MQEGKMNTKKYRRLRGQTLCVKQAQVATEMCPLRPLVALVMGVSVRRIDEVTDASDKGKMQKRT